MKSGMSWQLVGSSWELITDLINLIRTTMRKLKLPVETLFWLSQTETGRGTLKKTLEQLALELTEHRKLVEGLLGEETEIVVQDQPIFARPLLVDAPGPRIFVDALGGGQRCALDPDELRRDFLEERGDKSKSYVCWWNDGSFLLCFENSWVCFSQYSYPGHRNDPWEAGCIVLSACPSIF